MLTVPASPSCAMVVCCRHLLPLLFQFDASVVEQQEEGEEREGGGTQQDTGRAAKAAVDSTTSPRVQLGGFQAGAAAAAGLGMPPEGHGGSFSASDNSRALISSTPPSAVAGAGGGSITGIASLGMPLGWQSGAQANTTSSSGGAGIGLNVQAVRNKHALLAARAVARLTGYDALWWREHREGEGEGAVSEDEVEDAAGSEETAQVSAVAHTAIQTLLTPRLAAQLSESSPLSLLHTLTASEANPQVS